MVRRVMRDVKERCVEVVAADRKAIQSLRLGLRDGLRQSGIGCRYLPTELRCEAASATGAAAYSAGDAA
jgi:hypothetical protein